MRRGWQIAMGAGVVALGALAFGVGRLALRGPGSRGAAARGAAVEHRPKATQPAPGAAEPAEALDRLEVTVYYPSVSADVLIGEVHEIFPTAAPGDWAKQIVNDLISGPTTENALPALPAGTELRQVFVLDGGVVWVDFSSGLRDGLHGGSAEELFAIYSVVNSIALNVPNVTRVGLLIDGQPVDTLSGHVDLRRPLPPDRTLIAAQEAILVQGEDQEPGPLRRAA